MIKKIQLRGISRTPSDRMTSDGGCAESLNVHLDGQETAPTLRPAEIDDMKDADGNRIFPHHDYPCQWEAVYLHKTSYYQRAIIKVKESEGAYSIGTTNENGGVDSFLTLSEGESFVRCISLGNTLGIVTDQNIYWVIFKNGKYSSVVNDIPFPGFALFAKEAAASDGNDDGSGKIIRKITSSYSGKAYRDHARLPDFDDVKRDDMWAKIDEAIQTNARSGVFNYQMMAVLAVKLYDGTRLISSPVVLSPGFEFPFDIDLKYTRHHTYHYHYDSGNPEDMTTYTTEMSVVFKTAYKVFVKLSESADFFEGWEDSIGSIEIYLSPQVAANLDRNNDWVDDYAETYTEKKDEVPMRDPESGQIKTDEDGNIIWERIDNEDTTVGTAKAFLGEKDYSYEEQYLRASNFFLAASYEIDSANMAKLAEGVDVDLSHLLPEDASEEHPDGRSFNDMLQTQTRLGISSDMKHSSVIYTQAFQYNNRIIASGISERLSIASTNIGMAMYYDRLSLSDIWRPMVSTAFYRGGIQSFFVLQYRITFFLRDNAGHEFVLQAQEDGKPDIYCGYVSMDETYIRNAYGFLICPDSRAYRAEIEFSIHDRRAARGAAIKVLSADMKEHPYLNCAYWYGGMDKELLSAAEVIANLSDYATREQSFIDSLPNKLYVSETDNPFVFPLSSRYTFSGNVLGGAIATDALSTGQFGQFPLYVFTDDGIWTMESGSDGSFVTQKPLSRDVCANSGSITPIDKAVIFVTDKAVMMLSGSQVIDLSPNMNGRHFSIKAGSHEHIMLSSSPWSEYLPAVMDDTHFIAFMLGAIVAYDYKGNRILFFNESEKYAYAYMLKTNTWHKIYIDGYASAPNVSYILNAYPDTYVNAHIPGKGHHILNISTALDVTSNENLKGVIVTRPFDLDEPDVRKAIKSIRIRGQFNRHDVRYILLGSMDGISWGVLPSLRGGSYKLFRLILLTSLSPTERISWVDVDYEPRFAQKIR